MPIYEYICPSCQRRFEQLRPRSEATAQALCPDCGQSAPRAVSLFGFIPSDPWKERTSAAQAAMPDHDHGEGEHDHEHFHGEYDDF